jgi:hypothetical protein
MTYFFDLARRFKSLIWPYSLFKSSVVKNKIVSFAKKEEERIHFLIKKEC